jgi:hypothetical protein
MKTHEVESEKVVVARDLPGDDVPKEEPEQKIKENIEKKQVAEAEKAKKQKRKSATYWTDGATKSSASWWPKSKTWVEVVISNSSEESLSVQ